MHDCEATLVLTLSFMAEMGQLIMSSRVDKNRKYQVIDRWFRSQFGRVFYK